MCQYTSSGFYGAGVELEALCMIEKVLYIVSLKKACKLVFHPISPTNPVFNI